MAKPQIVVFYKDGTSQTGEADNVSFDLQDPANQGISRIFVAKSPSDAKIATEIFANQFKAPKPVGDET